MPPYNFRECTLNQKRRSRRKVYNLRPLKPKQMQRSKMTINDAPELLSASKFAHLQESTSRTVFYNVPEYLSSDEETDDEQGSAYFLSDGDFVNEQAPENPSSDEESVHQQANLPPDEELAYDQPPKHLISNEEVVQEKVTQNPSSNDEIIHENNILSKLMPPSRSDGFRTGDDLREILKMASSLLISDIKEAANAEKMIELSTMAFAYFNSIKVDYTLVYKAVSSVIHHQCEIEALAKQRPESAFAAKTMHEEAALELSEAKKRYSIGSREYEAAQREFDAITVRLNRLYDEVKVVKNEKTQIQTRLAATEADKATYRLVYSRAKSKLKTIAPKISEAQNAINEYERRWKETTDGLNRAMEELSSLRT